MPAISYSKENIEKYDFESKILKKIKKHTIRRYGPGLIKRPFKIGDTLYHYKNWRTPQVKKICENTCLYVADIQIYIIESKQTYNIIHPPVKIFRIEINNNLIVGEKLFILSMNDGFPCFEEFKKYFIKSSLPFYGQIIGWVEGINYT